MRGLFFIFVFTTTFFMSCKEVAQRNKNTFLPNIYLAPVPVNAQLPALRDQFVAKYQDKWLILGGSSANLHNFDGTSNNFIYVYNLKTKEINFIDITQTNLPNDVKIQLESTNPEFIQDADTIYMIGGYDTSNSSNLTTLNTITSMHVPGIVNAVINGDTNLAPYVFYRTDITQFKVTGGQLEKIENDFYLVFGHDCEGPYCSTSQTYTNSIYQFRTSPKLTDLAIINSVTHNELDGSGWRRRDYTLAPFILGKTPTLFALAGPFTPGDTPGVWTNGILFYSNLDSNNNFINQQANQYLAPFLSMHHADTQLSYVATFGGLSTLYWGANGLTSDSTLPYGNVLDLIVSDARGDVQEYVNLQPVCSGQPLASCVYMGLGAVFIPTGDYYNERRILQLERLPSSPVIVGYIYGGLIAPDQNILTTKTDVTTNRVYAVYVSAVSNSKIHWKNLTNQTPQD